MADTTVTSKAPSLTTDYSVIGCILFLYIAALLTLANLTPTDSVTAESIIRPIVVLVALTGLVWIAMLISRNLAVINGSATLRYFESYSTDIPAEWIERPARTYENLLELPVLFYLVCVLMLITGEMDQVQIVLAWAFVYTRIAHALVYICFNKVPYRLAAYVMGVIPLTVIWVRFSLDYSLFQ